MSRATTYAEITASVCALIDKHAENDPTVTAALIVRAALLRIAHSRGFLVAAEKAVALGIEMVQSERTIQE